MTLLDNSKFLPRDAIRLLVQRDIAPALLQAGSFVDLSNEKGRYSLIFLVLLSISRFSGGNVMIKGAALPPASEAKTDSAPQRSNGEQSLRLPRI